MKLRIAIATLAGVALIAGSAYAQSHAPPKLPRLAPAGAKGIRVQVDSTRYGHLIPSDYAFCTAAPQTHAAPAPDKSPRFAWSKGPAGTKSYAVFV
jgi:hypothetical protein